MDESADYIELAAALMAIGEGLYRFGKYVGAKAKKKKPRRQKRRKKRKR